MKSSKLHFTFLLVLLGAFLIPNNTFAQDEKAEKKKIVIVKKTVDKDGNEFVEKIVKEGDEAENFDVDKYLEKNGDDVKEIDVDVKVMSGDEKKMKEKTVEVKVEGNEVIIMNGDEKQVIKIDEGQEKNEIKTKDGKHIIIMRKDGDDINMEEMMGELEMEKEGEHHEKEIRIMRKAKGNGAFFGVMMDPTAEEGVTLLDVVEDSPAEKSGLKKGDVIQNIDGQKIDSYDSLTEVLSKKKPGDSIVVTYKAGDEVKKTKAELANAADMKIEEKMIWKTKDGEDIEIHGEHDVIIEEIIEEEEKDGKKTIKKKIIKKKKDN